MQICGICKRPPRIGEPSMRIRLTRDDMLMMRHPEGKQPGLYMCCCDCHAEYLPIVAARLGYTADSIPYQMEQ